MKKRIDDIMLKVKEVLTETCKPEQIIFFGSRVKGIRSVGSDFDFAVITQNKPDKNRLVIMKKRIEEISGPYKVDVEFLNDVDDEFKQIILGTGKVIYEKGS